ncbi:MAG: Eco57I restriction-modification methylase domain-containing protein [Paludibacteraceae bacterium]|nr:Eco57I restriction-modification methylase domain-containing protein [Paludibacteraceae bacterium]
MANQYSTFRAELIYIFRINDIAHSGCLKIGKTTVLDGTPYNAAPNSKMLNEAAKARIRQYTATAGIAFELLHTELSMSLYGKEWVVLNDKDIHNILLRSGIKRADFGDGMGVEWFECDLLTAQRAIQAAKEKRTSLLPKEITIEQSPIIFRPEQEDAIDRTCKKFKKSNQMLWNAKMRFGKTLSALEVVRRMGFNRTIIVTHRPVVDKGWYEDFSKIFHFESTSYMYGSRDKGTDLLTMENACALGRAKYIYFASMQDLRGTDKVGGKFAKNDKVFSTKWDCVIVDEAHEGTQTTLGKNVLNALTENKPKVLQLSGTPFNLFDQYKEDEIFTWDYVMEQKAKVAWDETHFGDANPYAGLPAMNIYTFDLGRLMSEYMDMDVAFNFTEFFRTKNSDGSFVHAADVRAFLDLMVKPDPYSMFPFANEEFRNNFHHTLRIVPDIKKAKALSKMLQAHPVFGNFMIVNVAGDGDDDSERGDALELVQKAIANNDYTITISCGKLTTGVSVPEWTAVFMLSGTFNTAASSYMQTIFRVQTPAKKDGAIKENCYVFDFAPDRTLKVVAETAKVQAKAGRTTQNDRKTLGDFLNFCPVISCDGTQMKGKITADQLFTQLKKVYVERVVSSGFEDKSLYNEDLLKLSDIELKQFAELKKIIGETKAMPRTNNIDINQQGLTGEQYDELEKIEKKPKDTRTPEENEKLAELKKAKEQRSAAISILRGISIRMPLLIYGAELTGNIKEVTLENFADLIDDLSWEEFMPKGVNKVVFHSFRKYYDPDIFLAAGKRIRALAEAADAMSVEQRIAQISAIFNSFRNPDKETVLTPWRVVNMHMSDCLGGYCFYDKDFTKELDEPRFVEQINVTNNVFTPNAKILEINSKSGLYPLYVTYSIYRTKLQNSLFACDTIEEQQRVWDEVVRENIFVICKTQMAQSITRRTLLGFRNGKCNMHAFDDLINQIKNNQKELIERINKGQVFKRFKDMKFNAIVGNPPYQENRSNEFSKNNSSFATAIYPYFVNIARLLKPQLISLVTPSRWMTRTGQGLSEEWIDGMIKSRNIRLLHDFIDATECFEGVEIKGGVCYYLLSPQYQGICKYILHKNGNIYERIGELDSMGLGIVLRDEKAINIINRVRTVEGKYFNSSFSTYVGPQHFFDKDGYLTTSWRNYSKVRNLEHNIKYYLNKTLDKTGVGWIRLSDIPKNREVLPLHKIYIPKVGGSGNDPYVLGKPFYGEPNSVCSQTYLVIGYSPEKHNFTEEICYNIIKYIKTLFFRYLVSIKKRTQDNPSSVFQFVPLQDFTSNSDIDWSKSIEEIDKQLYAKYNLSEDEIDFIEKMIKPMN